MSHARVDVLVTGSAGFIGEALLHRLSQLGVDARGVDVRAGWHPTIRMDVTNATEVSEVFRRLSPRRVIHAAAVVDDRVSYRKTERVNVRGTENVLAAAKAADVSRFVHVSSIAAFGIDPGDEVDDASPVRTEEGAAYFDTKARSDELARAAALPTVVVRPGDVYGPRSIPWVERPLALMRRGSPVLVDGGRGYMAHCYVDNLVDALVAALERPEAIGGAFTVHDDARTTYREYFRALADAGRVAMPRTSIPKPAALFLARAADGTARVVRLRAPLTEAAVRYVCRDTRYDITAARSKLGYEPRVDLAEGMHRLREALA